MLPNAKAKSNDRKYAEVDMLSVYLVDLCRCEFEKIYCFLIIQVVLFENKKSTLLFLTLIGAK